MLLVAPAPVNLDQNPPEPYPQLTVFIISYFISKRQYPFSALYSLTDRGVNNDVRRWLLYIGSARVVDNWRANMGSITSVLYNSVSDWYRKGSIG